MTKIPAVLFLIVSLTGGGCRKPTPPSGADGPSSEPVNQPTRETQRKAPPEPPAPKEIWNAFSGENAFAHVKQLVDLGPRPSGSKALEEARATITAALEQHHWRVERQSFSDVTPRGSIEFVNLVARFSPPGQGSSAAPASQKIIVASHYDTKLFDTIRFVGANDSGSSTGALMELARVLSLDWRLASRIELVFFDGEEALSQFTETDGLYGSRHYAKRLVETNRSGQFIAGIVWDMIGDRDLTITLSPDSPPALVKEIFAAAEALQLRQHFAYYSRPVWDDHVPLNRIKIPTIDLIDFDYLPWHTADDTIDKVSAESLEKIGRVTLYYLHRVFGSQG